MKINNYKNMLIISVSIFVLSMSYFLSENIDPSCCGGVLPGVHYLESDTKPPKIIKRCLKDWNSFPCTNKDSPNCCVSENRENGENGEKGECIPTDKGGYCKMSDGNKIYKNGKLTPTMFLGSTIDLDDPGSYEGEVDISLTREDLYDRRVAERNEAIRLKRDSESGNLGYTTEEQMISATQEILWWIYLIHLSIILILSLLLYKSLPIVIQGYVGTITKKINNFMGI